MRLKIWNGSKDAEPGCRSTAFDGDLEQLYTSEAPRLQRRLARRLSPDRAADVVQTAFLRLLGIGPDRLKALEQPRAYLHRVVVNLANDHEKSSANRLEHKRAEEWSISDDPHPQLEARDMLRRIEAAIPLMPDRTREIFMAHRFENLTYDDIAARLGVSVKTVEKHISIALRTLHRSVGQRR